MVAVDVRGSTPLVRGWSEATALDLADVLTKLNGFELAGILVTAVHVEGRLDGPDLTLVETVTRASRHRVIASGGVAGIADLRALDASAAWGAVIGMALYTGHMDAARCAREFGGGAR